MQCFSYIICIEKNNSEECSKILMVINSEILVTFFFCVFLYSHFLSELFKN